jgi:hypothetical protein
LRRAERVFEPIARALDEVLDRYSERELATLLDFIERTRTLVDREVERLRGPAAGSADAAR